MFPLHLLTDFFIDLFYYHFHLECNNHFLPAPLYQLSSLPFINQRRLRSEWFSPWRHNLFVVDSECDWRLTRQRAHRNTSLACSPIHQCLHGSENQLSWCWNNLTVDNNFLNSGDRKYCNSPGTKSHKIHSVRWGQS